MRVEKFPLLITACASAVLCLQPALAQNQGVAKAKPHLHGKIKSPASTAGAVSKNASARAQQAAAQKKKQPDLGIVIFSPQGSYVSNPSPTDSHAAQSRRESMPRYAQMRAQDLIRKKDYEGALREMNEAIMAYPDASYVMARAELYELMGRYDDAARDWNRIYSDCPQAHRDLLLGAEYFKKRADYVSALKFCDLSLKAYPTAEALRTRAEINKAAGNYRQAVADAYTAYRTALADGADGQPERVLLKSLLGKEPAVPQPPREKVAAVLAAIKILAESKKPFSPALTAQLTRLQLKEMPQEGTLEHTGLFESLGKDGASEWWRVELDRWETSGCRSSLSLVLNPTVVSISEEDVRQQFGPCEMTPDRSTMCILDPAHMEYIRPWGKMRFSFYDSGFKSLCSVQLDATEEPVRTVARALKTKSAPTFRSGSRKKG